MFDGHPRVNFCGTRSERRHKAMKKHLKKRNNKRKIISMKARRTMLGKYKGA